MMSIGGYVVSVILVFLAVTAATVVNAAEIREIELTDGSVITGEIVSLSGGIYTVRSATLGTLRIEASNIRVIRLQGSAAPSDVGGQVKSLEDKMHGDKEIMDAIRALQNDPDLQKVLHDPEIMKAIQSGDIAALMRNPDFMKLLNKQPVQDINKKLAR
ncbi:MAG: hypothetical protein M1497_05035 [Nitrospirae bacterium]|nr:hypothetical protein [Nitrospirota bacterium]